jgi:hypothetical protein
MAPIHTFVYFLDTADVQAYIDAKPSSTTKTAPLTISSDACWGSQIGLEVCNGTLLPLFKMQSMSIGINFCQGSYVAWFAVCQERNSVSSCEAKVQATNNVSKLVKEMGHFAASV